MKRMGATAVRIHGFRRPLVLDAVNDAHANGLRVWLSYRPNMWDLGIRDADGEPCASPSLWFCRTNKAKLSELRQLFQSEFQKFLEDIKGTLKKETGDCLVIANELPIDLGYRYDKDLGYDQQYNDCFPSEQELLSHLVSTAHRILSDQVQLTYASLDENDPSNNPSVWKAIGLDFARSTAIALKTVNLSKVLATLKQNSGLQVALTGIWLR